MFHSKSDNRDLYLYHLSNPIRLNGKLDDWQDKLLEAKQFGRENLLFNSEEYDPHSFHFKQLAGVRGKYLYTFFKVFDDRVVYRTGPGFSTIKSDHLRIGIENRDGSMNQYLLTAKEPGWINGHLILDELYRPQSPQFTTKIEQKIQGVWRETGDGYIVELRFPREMVGDKFAFNVVDVDDASNPQPKYIVGTLAAESGSGLGWLLSGSEAIKNILATLTRPQSRVLIVDTNRKVRASYGDLSEKVVIRDNTHASLLSRLSSFCHKLLAPLYRYFIVSFSASFKQPETELSTLDIEGIDNAMEGETVVSRYFLEDGQVEIMAAITPLFEEDSIVGAVVVEQTTNSILALQNRVIEESLTLTILVFSITGTGFIFFAFRLSSRISRLGKQAATAIDDSGQIKQTILTSSSRDEIGELSRTLTSMLSQLKSQVEFREMMADNLEHEMRTPLAGISASLKNIEKELQGKTGEPGKYIRWAMKDLKRVDSLLAAIRDASNLQEALEQDEKEEFKLDIGIEKWLTHSWQPAFKDVSFKYLRPETNITMYGDPGRIHQMLDKLIENAVSFHELETPVTISLEKKDSKIELYVENYGPPIPIKMQAQIFNSMVSMRSQNDQKAHLGLGLFIVRTIASHHGGTVRASSSESDNTTRFTITL